MLYDGKNPILRVIGVAHMNWKSGYYQVAPRPYSALAFRIRGTAEITSGGREYHVNTNDILYLPQNMEYTAGYTDTEMIVIHFVTAREDKEIELFSFENGETFYKAFLRAHTLWENKEAAFEVYVMAQLYGILGMVFEKEIKAVLPPHFLKAVSYLNSDFRSSSLSIGIICSYAGISETLFRQLFRAHYNKTPVEYITDLRLEYARNLIAGGVSVETAALESGFNDSKYFARVVKKRFGCTPRALREYSG